MYYPGLPPTTSVYGQRRTRLVVGSFPAYGLVTYPADVLDREGPVPPYQQIAAILKERILSGEIPPGRRIPSIRELEVEFSGPGPDDPGPARDTIRKAIKVLIDEGLVYTVQGMGTFVADHPGKK